VAHLRLGISFGDEPEGDGRRHVENRSRRETVERETVELLLPRCLDDAYPHEYAK
jgi:hypothetical protein